MASVAKGLRQRIVVPPFGSSNLLVRPFEAIKSLFYKHSHRLKSIGQGFMCHVENADQKFLADGDVRQ